MTADALKKITTDALDKLAALLDEGQGPDAVPLHLHRPVGQAAGRRRAREGEHRRDRRGQRGPSGVAHPPLGYPDLPASYRYLAGTTSDAASRRSGS